MSIRPRVRDRGSEWLILDSNLHTSRQDQLNRFISRQAQELKRIASRSPWWRLIFSYFFKCKILYREVSILLRFGLWRRHYVQMTYRQAKIYGGLLFGLLELKNINPWLKLSFILVSKIWKFSWLKILTMKRSSNQWLWLWCWNSESMLIDFKIF